MIGGEIKGDFVAIELGFDIDELHVEATEPYEFSAGPDRFKLLLAVLCELFQLVGSGPMEDLERILPLGSVHQFLRNTGFYLPEVPPALRLNENPFIGFEIQMVPIDKIIDPVLLKPNYVIVRLTTDLIAFAAIVFHIANRPSFIF